jgi:hypothetical protein
MISFFKIMLCIFILLFGCSSHLSAIPAKFNIYLHSGITFPTTPGYFADFYPPDFNIGGGVGYQLSERLTLQLTFSHYIYYPRQQYWKYIYIGDSETPVPLPGKGLYCGNHFYSFYDFFSSLKFKPWHRRLAPYMVAGFGATYRRHVVGGYVGLDGERLYVGKSIFYIATGGFGVEYKLKRNIGIFLEATYIYSFWKIREKNRGNIPLKIGIIKYINSKRK